MPFAAITYDIKPGFEAELTEIFGSFRRVRSDRVRTESGEEAAGSWPPPCSSGTTPWCG